MDHLKKQITNDVVMTLTGLSATGRQNYAALDIKEITKALVKLLNNDQLAHKLGKNGRNRVEKELNYFQMAKKIERVIK